MLLRRIALSALGLLPFTSALALAHSSGGFTFNGKTFPSQQAFVESGSRCSTPPVEEFLANRLENDFQRWKTAGMAAPDSVSVDIAFHVIHDGENGKLAAEDLQAQVDVLNAAYAGSGVSFEVSSVDYTDNAAWFTMTAGSVEEYNAKHSLNIDPFTHLNF